MSETINPQGNPQGKGVVMVLQQMAAAAPAEIRPKSADEALLDYWCSSLVLSSAFKFRVAPDNTYFLYRVGAEWQLSLIAPAEWGARMPGEFVAECQLSRDMTWQLQFDDGLSQTVRGALIAFLEGFQAQAASSSSFDEMLPDYVESLPYQQRVLASALKRSLKHSLRLGGDNGVGLLAAVVERRLSITQ